ncbi:glycosyl transferase [Haematococcus lacustris]
MAAKRGAVQREVLVTVGTTKFDALIKAVDNQAFVDALKQKGYSHLAVQKGNGSYFPKYLLPSGELEATLSNGVHVRCFDYQPNLNTSMQQAALIISHAGSGSIFEALSLGKHLIVVPNAALMDNHQVELAEQLAAMKHLACTTPDKLVETLQQLDGTRLIPYVRGDAAQVAKHISAALGVVSS